MMGRLYEGSGMIIFWILVIAAAVLAAVLLYFYTSIFWPFIVPMIFIFKPLKNMLISGLIGLLLFAYFIADLKLQLVVFNEPIIIMVRLILNFCLYMCVCVIG